MKTPKDFPNLKSWFIYVHENFPAEEAPYMIGAGLTHMYRRFYELRSHPFPERFSVASERIASFNEPARTQAQEELNGEIMADMIQLLMTASAGATIETVSRYPVTPREIIEELLEHLRTNNAYFALWERYKQEFAKRGGVPDWRAYLARTMDGEDDREIAFASLMSELGRCLELYQQREMRLPKRFYFQIWFLHRTLGPERNAMTRALMQELVKGLEPCASA